MVFERQCYLLTTIFIFLSVITFQINTSQIPRPRGVSLSRAPLYPPRDTFVCLDGSLTIPFTHVNDDYCDCKDGSDEPGTSACPNGIFHCTNAGHTPINIPSSRVNDGICDCCDASDEYARPESKCTNICFELGHSARVEAQKRAELLKAGSAKRNELIQKASNLKTEKQERYDQLQKQKLEAEKIKAEKEKLKNDAEELENAALEKYRKIEEEEKHKKHEQEKEEDMREAEAQFARFDSNQDNKLDVSEIQSRILFDTDKNGEVSEQEAKYFLDDSTEILHDDFYEKAWPRIKPYTILEKGLFQPPKNKDEDDEDEDDEGDGENVDEQIIRAEETLEEEEQVEQIDEDDDSVAKSAEQPEQTQEYDEETQKLINQATEARNEYNSADRDVRDIQSEMKNIEEYLEKDYGPENEFAMLQGECFEYVEREYTYKLCPFDRALQIPRSGGAETRLGVWGRWSGPSNEEKYTQMLYDRGTSCWNGPQRSTRVNVACGIENKLVHANEPNRCEYEFNFETPAACYEPPESQTSDDQHDEL